MALMRYQGSPIVSETSTSSVNVFLAQRGNGESGMTAFKV
jgi:hypothetical protein